jgi:hypothetical protein
MEIIRSIPASLELRRADLSGESARSMRVDAAGKFKEATAGDKGGVPCVAKSIDEVKPSRRRCSATLETIQT